MATAIRSRAAEQMLDELESVWSCLDDLFASFGPNDWRRRHGPDWTYADVPYHLSYFDLEIVAGPLARRQDVAIAEQRVQRSRRELDAWNARMFARRPMGQTVDASLAGMRAARDIVRREIGRLNDDDLEAPVFVPLIGCGWVPARSLLGAAVAHGWGHYTEARLRLGRRGPVPSAAATHRTLEFFMTLMPHFANRDEASKGPFTAVMRFTGPGGGDWTIRAVDGAVFGYAGAAENPDVVMTQSADTFEKTHSKLASPLWLMLTGQLKIKGFAKMGRFGKLMAFPGPDVDVEPMRAHL